MTSFVPVTAALAAFFLVLPSTGADATVRIVEQDQGWAFEPQAASVEPGARVAFRNLTRVTHTADCVECPWRSGDVQPGEIAFVPLGTAGTFDYRCRYHPEFMTGQITVSAT
jgi:plastocyanin